MEDFAGKTAIVTGAASGIGLGLAERFAAAGMRVVLADIERDVLHAVTTNLRERGYQVTAVVTDTMRKESVASMFAEAVERHGRIHILCNNAGVASSLAKSVWEIADGDWRWVLGVNFYGVLHGIQVAVPHMLGHGEPSHIVNTASLAALMPVGGTYGVSKHAVLALTEGLHRDLQAAKANIGVSILCPGLVNTRIYDAERNRPAEFRSGEPSQHPGAELMRKAMEQGLSPQAVAEAVFTSIQEKRFYVLPHPAWDRYIRARFEHILARGAPAEIDLADIERRRAEGEVF